MRSVEKISSAEGGVVSAKPKARLMLNIGSILSLLVYMI